MGKYYICISEGRNAFRSMCEQIATAMKCSEIPTHTRLVAYLAARLLRVLPLHLLFAPRLKPSPSMNARLIDDINEKLSALLRASPAADVQKSLKAALSQALGKMDLVTREEFDVQAQVLARTREKLTTLEARLTEIEKRASGA